MFKSLDGMQKLYLLATRRVDDSGGDDGLELLLTTGPRPGTGGGRENLGLEVHLAHVGEGAVLGVLVHVGHRLVVLLLVVDEAAAVRSSPGALVTLVWMLACVASPVVYKIVRPLEFFTTKVTSVSKLSFMHKLMLLQRVFEFKCHPTIFTRKVSNIRVDLEVNVVCRDLVKSLATFFTAPAVSTNTMRSQMNVDTMSGFEFLPTFLTAVRSVCGVFEEHMELHVALSVELSRTLRTRINGRKTFSATSRSCMACLMLEQLLIVSKVSSTV